MIRGMARHAASFVPSMHRIGFQCFITHGLNCKLGAPALRRDNTASACSSSHAQHSRSTGACSSSSSSSSSSRPNAVATSTCAARQGRWVATIAAADAPSNAAAAPAGAPRAPAPRRRAKASAAAASAPDATSGYAAPAPTPDSSGAPAPPMKRLYIIDTMAQAYRLHTGFGTQRLTDSEGRDTSMLHGFMAILLRVLAHKPPATHMAIVVDAPGATFRHLMYAGYKAQRPPPPPDLLQHVLALLTIVNAMGIPVLCVNGVEADDVIGSLAMRFLAEHRNGSGSAAGDQQQQLQQQGGDSAVSTSSSNDGGSGTGGGGGVDGDQEGAHAEVVIVSTDKDFKQLLRPGLKLMRMVKRDVTNHPSAFYTHEDFAVDTGLRSPELWADVLALMGDASDNVPGVKGIGEKTALGLVQQLGTVEQVLQRAPEYKFKQKRQLEMLQSEEGKAAALLCKQLVTIVTDLKVPEVRDTPLELFELRVPPDGGAAAVAKLREYGLEQSIERLSAFYKRWGSTGGRPFVA